MSRLLIVLMLSSSLFAIGCKARSQSGTVDNASRPLIDPDYVYPSRPAVNIDSVFVDGNILTMRVNYSGGCKEHYFMLKSNGKFSKSSPPAVKMFLDDTVKTDNCRQFKEEIIKININNLRHPSKKKVILQLGDGHDVEYSY